MPIGPVLHCKLCGTPIRLPYPMPDRTSDGPPNTPKAYQSTIFACHKCGRAFGYRAQDFRWEASCTSAPSQGRATVVWCCEFSCGPNDCMIGARIHTLAGERSTKTTIAKRAIRAQYNPSCPNKHRVQLIGIKPADAEKLVKSVFVAHWDELFLCPE